MVQLPAEFRAQVESYRGPLDLLLFLIKRDEVDVFDIPIARIIEQYQIYMEVLQRVDPNLCGEFLVMAAQLMEIKSKLLLPREELSEDEEFEDPRLELVRQLLEYKKYKERALLLRQRVDERNRRHERPRQELEWDDFDEGGPVEIGNVSVWDLFTAFHRIQLLIGQREPHRVVDRDRPIEEYVEEIRSILSNSPNRTARFEDLFTAARSREEAVGLLLAILELAKERLLLVYQEELFGPIEVCLRDEEEVRQAEEDLAREDEALVDPGEKFLREGEGLQAVVEPVEVETAAAPTASKDVPAGTQGAKDPAGEEVEKHEGSAPAGDPGASTGEEDEPPEHTP